MKEENSPRFSFLRRTIKQLLIRHENIVIPKATENAGVIELRVAGIDRPYPIIQARKVKHRNGRRSGENLGVFMSF